MLLQACSMVHPKAWPLLYWAWHVSSSVARVGGRQATSQMQHLVDLLGDEAVGVAGLADELEGAASEAGHDGVALAASITCAVIIFSRHEAQVSRYPGLTPSLPSKHLPCSTWLLGTSPHGQGDVCRWAESWAYHCHCRCHSHGRCCRFHCCCRFRFLRVQRLILSINYTCKILQFRRAVAHEGEPSLLEMLSLGMRLLKISSLTREPELGTAGQSKGWHGKSSRATDPQGLALTNIVVSIAVSIPGPKVVVSILISITRSKVVVPVPVTIAIAPAQDGEGQAPACDKPAWVPYASTKVRRAYKP